MLRTKLTLILTIFIFLIGHSIAYCQLDQVDINTASLKDLDRLTGIGPAKGQAIIDARPYKSLDELVNAYGIGPATLQKIKDQDLACIDSEEESEEPNILEEREQASPKTAETTPRDHKSPKKTDSEEVSQSIINLGSEQLGGEVVYESKNEKINKNLIYAFYLFLLIILYLLIRR